MLEPPVGLAFDPADPADPSQARYVRVTWPEFWESIEVLSLTVNRIWSVGRSRSADVGLTVGNAVQVLPPLRLYDQAPAIEVVASLVPAAVMATPSWVPVSRSTPMLAP